MIFSVLFFVFIVLMICRCKYRSKNKNKIKSIAPLHGGTEDPSRTIVLKNVGEMPAVDLQAYSPVVASPQVRERDPERGDSDTGSNCNGANSQV